MKEPGSTLGGAETERRQPVPSGVSSSDLECCASSPADCSSFNGMASSGGRRGLTFHEALTSACTRAATPECVHVDLVPVDGRNALVYTLALDLRLRLNHFVDDVLERAVDVSRGLVDLHGAHGHDFVPELLVGRHRDDRVHRVDELGARPLFVRSAAVQIVLAVHGGQPHSSWLCRCGGADVRLRH